MIRQIDPKLWQFLVLMFSILALWAIIRALKDYWRK